MRKKAAGVTYHTSAEKLRKITDTSKQLKKATSSQSIKTKGKGSGKKV